MARSGPLEGVRFARLTEGNFSIGAPRNPNRQFSVNLRSSEKCPSIR